MKIFQDTGSLWGEANVCSIFQQLYLRTGDTRSAEDMTIQGLKILESLEIPTGIRDQLMLGLAIIRTLQGNTGEAESIVMEYSRREMKPPMLSWWTECILSCIESFRGRRDRAVDHARTCMQISMAQGYDRLITEQLILLLVPLAGLYELGESRNYLQGIFSKIDPDLKATLSQMESMGISEITHACRTILGALPPESPPGLEVVTLGRFSIIRGAEEIHSHDWSSRKARMLFKLLVHYRAKGYMSKEVFMEHLWPDEDPRKTAKRFHVALGTVRKMLEVDGGRVVSPYILSDGDSYLLDLGQGGRVDLDEFEEACSRAADAREDIEAVRHLLRAEDLYQGDFLEEDLYETWCIEERERIRDRYLSVLASIVDYYEAKKDFTRAADYCNRYLTRDPYAEDVYQRLMRCQAMLGNRAMVKKTYEKCRKSMADLDCPLSKET
ncbi:MAG: bacterial transcriptional activator domain-containing protein, partial [Methanothrix sp.]|nr:bacterial transcriptional activator domain-containing protein [Methanothrix sp.]